MKPSSPRYEVRPTVADKPAFAVYSQGKTIAVAPSHAEAVALGISLIYAHMHTQKYGTDVTYR